MFLKRGRGKKSSRGGGGGGMVHSAQSQTTETLFSIWHQERNTMPVGLRIVCALNVILEDGQVETTHTHTHTHTHTQNKTASEILLYLTNYLLEAKING